MRDRLALPRLSTGRGGHNPPRPFPLAALMERLDLHTPEELACVIGASTRTAHRLLAEGMLGEVLADRLCQRAGLHPSDVWGELWWHPEEEAQAS
jgi:hypothetical protein